ncbi:DUF4031 domain-containing protein [Nesterenkonia sp. AY15]|uniref:DUF4031 domain-containing protein n=1 Tax=Nesterenkonia sp. AY15 TaxID=2901139 RepID=UPI001F4C5BD3|nr:DUF4031 domain-containing protein [Nesterenkonia sp. AY15]MCH8572036.1 DUF4031 domain-containing protein [Nesterenkonia sp. AY15]
MTIYIDPPSWPAHDTVFSHLISDHSLQELHQIAAAAGVSIRAFDRDHYDVPAHLFDELTALGAVPVSGGELTRILLGCGLRIPAAQRPEKLRRNLQRAWLRLGTRWEALDGTWTTLGEELLTRWSEPHRNYHSLTHLNAVLRGVSTLERAGELSPEQRPVVSLAAWFHDAVYVGVAEEDEEASASLAESRLGALLPTHVVGETARLVRLTTHHDPPTGDRNGAVLVDADLEVLAQTPGGYARYVAAVRRDYHHVAEDDFRRGRARVLQRLLAAPSLFHTATGVQRWEPQARVNLTRELELLSRR